MYYFHSLPGCTIIRLDGETLADSIPLDLENWERGSEIRERPVLDNGWQHFTASLIVALHQVKDKPRPFDPKASALRFLNAL